MKKRFKAVRAATLSALVAGGVIVPASFTVARAGDVPPVLPASAAHMTRVGGGSFCGDGAAASITEDGELLQRIDEGRPGTGSGRDHHSGDMAFWGSRAVVACGADDGDLHNDGFALLDIKEPNEPALISRFRCVASASDIAMWGDLVFLAVDRNNDTLPGFRPPTTNSDPEPLHGPVGDSCDADVQAHHSIEDRNAFFQGIRIVSIADQKHPVVVANVKLGNSGGAHNLTILPDPDSPTGPRLRVFAVSGDGSSNWIVDVPIDTPSSYRVVDVANSCHDLSFFLPRRIAACSRGSLGTTIWDLDRSVESVRRDGTSVYTPTAHSFIRGSGRATGEAPSIMTQCSPDTATSDGRCLLHNPGASAHQSSAVSWDGNTLIVSDEDLRQTGGSCSPDGVPQGAVWFYDIRDLAHPVLLGSHHAPRAITQGWCISKQMSVLPLENGRDVVAVAWQTGGVSVIEFGRTPTGAFWTDEIGHFVADPGADSQSAAWTAYWYDGYVWVNNAWGCMYGTACVGGAERGLDVLRIDADLGQAVRLRRFHFALQECLRSTAPAPGAFVPCG